MTDTIERAARALCEQHHIAPDIVIDGEPNWHDFVDEAKAALASLRPGDQITLADGTECWIAPMEPTPAMSAAAWVERRNRHRERLGPGLGCGEAFTIMRDACMKENEG